MLLSSTSSDSQSDKLLIETAQKKGLEALKIDPRKISYAFTDKIKIFIGSSDISHAQIMLVRRTRGAELETYQLAKAMEMRGCSVTDPSEALIYATDKLVPQLQRFTANYHPNTMIANKFDTGTIDNVIETIGFPMFVKPINGTRQKNNSRVENKRQLDAYLYSNPKGIIFQEYLDIKSLYRVCTIGGKAVARTFCPSSKNYDIPADNAIKIAEYVAGSIAYQIVGWDIARVNQHKHYILEANRNPNILSLEERFNMSEKIIDYCLHKTSTGKSSGF